jgi:leader peptidase (prepilin peptidase)/N-methyltransferase
MAIGAALCWCLLSLSWFDALLGRLPDALTLPLCIGGLVAAVLTGPSWIDRVAGAVSGLALPLLAFWIYRLRKGYDGLGIGDLKLFGAVGAWLGWEVLPFVVLLSSLLAVLYVLLLAADPRQSLPFGPFIAVTAWAAWIVMQRGLWS